VKFSEVDWPALYARVCAQTGWTWEYVGQHLTLPRLAALNKYWQHNPPLHLGAGLPGGLGAGPAREAPADNLEALHAFAADFQALGGRMG
jgi:hypothetical protein